MSVIAGFRGMACFRMHLARSDQLARSDSGRGLDKTAPAWRVVGVGLS